MARQYTSGQVRSKVMELASDSLETIAEMILELETEVEELHDSNEQLLRAYDEAVQRLP